MLRTLQHTTRTFALLACLLVVWGNSALYASSPIEFCIDKQGHVYIIPTAEGITTDSFTGGTFFRQAASGIAVINNTENHNSATSTSVQLIKADRFLVCATIDISSYANRSSTAYLFYSDLPPPSVNVA